MLLFFYWWYFDIFNLCSLLPTLFSLISSLPFLIFMCVFYFLSLILLYCPPRHPELVSGSSSYRLLRDPSASTKLGIRMRCGDFVSYLISIATKLCPKRIMFAKVAVWATISLFLSFKLNFTLPKRCLLTRFFALLLVIKKYPTIVFYLCQSYNINTMQVCNIPLIKCSHE